MLLDIIVLLGSFSVEAFIMCCLIVLALGNLCALIIVKSIIAIVELVSTIISSRISNVAEGREIITASINTESRYEF